MITNNDIERIRDRVRIGGAIGPTDGANLLEEIDRLRDEKGRLRRLFEQETGEVNKAKAEIDRLRDKLAGESPLFEDRYYEIAREREQLLVEVSALREQLRPRSIKDEPPPLGIPILLGHNGESVWYGTNNQIPLPSTGDCFEWWLPMPPAPPKPDAFEVWWKEKFLQTDLQFDSKTGLRMAWNAAIESTKKGHE